MGSASTDSISKGTLVPDKKQDYDEGGWKAEFTKASDAIPAYIIGATITTTVALLLAQYFDPGAENRLVESHRDYYYPGISKFIFGYYCLLIVSRWAESDSHVLYEQLWACNAAMLISAIAMVINQPFLSSVCCALVAIDQLLWYVDFIGFICSGFKKFPIGVAGYLMWPHTSFIKKITSFHHLWFQPVLLWTLKYRMMDNSFYASSVLSTTLFCICRLLTPFHCLVAKTKGDKPIQLYLNINGCYAFWKDIKVKSFHRFNHSKVYLPFVSIFGNLALNMPANVILAGILYGITCVFDV